MMPQVSYNLFFCESSNLFWPSLELCRQGGSLNTVPLIVHARDADMISLVNENVGDLQKGIRIFDNHISSTTSFRNSSAGGQWL